MSRTLQQFTELAKGAIRGCSDADAAAIGALSFKAQRDGGNAAIWHSSARHFGHRCHCVPCERERERFRRAMGGAPLVHA